MADDAARLGDMMRKHLLAAVQAGKSQARKEGEIIANIMRATAPRDQGNLINSIRVEDADVRKLSGGPKGAYARRAGSASAGDNTSRVTGFFGVVVKAGDETTLVKGEKAGKKSGVRRGTEFQNARLQEHGTKNMPANPYFNSSYRRRRTQAKSNISKALRKGWLKG